MRDKIIIRGKYTFRTAKRPPVKKKKVRDNRENSARERSAEFGGANNAPVAISLEYTVGLCWFLDILFFSHPLLTDWRDLKAHNPFDINHHRKFPGKQKEIHLHDSFGCRPISLSSTAGSCLFLDMWCAWMLPSFWTVEIRNPLSGKVSFMLNSSSSIFRRSCRNWIIAWSSSTCTYSRWVHHTLSF